MTFTSNIPTISQSLSVSRPLIENNFTNYKTNMEINHAGVNSATKGKHTLIQMPTVQAASPGTAAGEMAFYTKTVAGEPQLFMQTENVAAAGTDIQMTKALTASLSQLGAFANYGAQPPGGNQSGGYTFLPGGMLLQYGFYTDNLLGIAATGSVEVEFPITFPTASFAVYGSFRALSLISFGPSGLSAVPKIGSTTTIFNLIWSGGSGATGIYWWALGN